MIKTLIITFAFLLFMPVAHGAEVFGIAATVNKDAISESDVYDRSKLVLATAGIQNTKANRSKVRRQAIDSLIEEQIKIQEARRQNLEVTEADISSGFEAIAAQNKLNGDQFSQVLKQQGIPKSTLLSQIRAQIAWTKVIQSVLRPQVDVTETDVNAKMEILKDNIGGVEYQASEIFLPVTTAAEEADVKQMAQRLVQEIKFDGVAFEKLAKQFSKSHTAENGGSMGWISEGKLPKEMDLVIRNLAEGQVSSPIRTASGFHILTVTKRRTASGETLPSQDDVLSSIGLERLDRLQQRYLADLKSAAFIDRRN